MADGPDNYSARGIYKGPLHNLKDRAASLTVYTATGRVMAQFDDVETGYAFGLHDFASEHFDITPEGS